MLKLIKCFLFSFCPIYNPEFALLNSASSTKWDHLISNPLFWKYIDESSTINCCTYNEVASSGTRSILCCELYMPCIANCFYQMRHICHEVIKHDPIFLHMLGVPDFTNQSIFKNLIFGDTPSSYCQTNYLKASKLQHPDCSPDNWDKVYQIIGCDTCHQVFIIYKYLERIINRPVVANCKFSLKNIPLTIIVSMCVATVLFYKAELEHSSAKAENLQSRLCWPLSTNLLIYPCVFVKQQIFTGFHFIKHQDHMHIPYYICHFQVSYRDTFASQQGYLFVLPLWHDL